MKLIKYKRVSGVSQATDGEGLDAQDALQEAWAAANGHDIIGECVDAGLSGTLELDSRPGLSCAMARAKEEGAGVLIPKLDRLARDLIQQELILGEYRRAGVPVFSTVAAENDLIGHDAADPTRTLIRQILGAVAQYERALVCLRMAGGKAVKKSKGGRTDGVSPYGWCTIGKGVLVPVEDEQIVLGEVRRLRAEGFTLRRIAAWLDEHGHPSRSGAPWAFQTVHGLLRAPEVPVGAAGS